MVISKSQNTAMISSNKYVQVELINKYNPYFINMNKKGMDRMENFLLSRLVPAEMEITSERALKIKQALIRQYEDQHGVEVIHWTEKKKEQDTTPA